CQHYYNAPYSF
nr:immunoglobulin light chain junction region [Macaca mulatta]